MDIYTKTEQLQERQCWIEAVQLLLTGQNSQKIPCEPGHLGCLEAAVECLPAHSQKYREVSERIRDAFAIHIRVIIASTYLYDLAS